MKTPPPIWFYRLGYRFAHIKGTPKTADEKNLDAFRQVVVVIDKLGKKATMETIYEHIGGRKETCRANIKGWAARGWLQRDSDRKPYTVTEEGRKEAQIDTV
jgi:PHD/YefM family antitoxin component YafN of YafNO toxin-antitoxin module